MGELYFGTPTDQKAIIPCYLRELDKDMPILHLCGLLKARNLDPRSEVDRMKAAVITLGLAADEFQKEVQARASARTMASSEMETQYMLLAKMEPLQRSRQAILDKLEILAGDTQICSEPELIKGVADLQNEMLTACAGISMAAWRRPGYSTNGRFV